MEVKEWTKKFVEELTRQGDIDPVAAKERAEAIGEGWCQNMVDLNVSPEDAAADDLREMGIKPVIDIDKIADGK